jgi:MinD-like ATPase involved in chromosome partitioning or flagellar assembly
MPGAGVVAVLVAAGGAPWETGALDALSRRGSGATVHRRCVDLPDLLGAAGTGMAAAALVAGDLPGLDADAVDALTRAGVAVVAVIAPDDQRARERLPRIGVRRLLGPDLAGLLPALTELGERPGEPVDEGSPPADDEPQSGRVLAVWGPAGAPGRTTVAVGVAAELGHRGRSVLLLDADPYGGAVAQHLGVLDGVSGLLAAARSANAGRLDAPTLALAARSVGAGPFRVLTGLPRPDRWPEVRPAAFEELLAVAGRIAGTVVVDVGFSLESDTADPFGTAPQRNAMTLTAMEGADRILVVGAADPVGLARLARGLVDLRECLPDADVHVVVNRTRSTLGWSQQEVRGMVEGFIGPVPVGFLPEDRATADRALMAGASLVELGDSPLRRGIAELVDDLDGARTGSKRRAPRRVLRRRRAGRAR